ncbi:hypothetical protein MMYC01_206363 [Madurella mycetomatis]|uniref:Uncharacterized protein n=1 Tax=Madurella mycetomatis TaxID=100816 RepID=A0A175W4V5_9PEZI|nr:hypothetical protein MMYC01_206363 [Madurella mycetomatis]
MSFVPRYGGFGRFPTSVSARLENIYSISVGEAIGNNPPRDFSGAEFADGESFTENDGLAIEVDVPAARDVTLSIVIRDSLSPANSPNPGFLQVQSATYTIQRQILCP